MVNLYLAAAAKWDSFPSPDPLLQHIHNRPQSRAGPGTYVPTYVATSKCIGNDLWGFHREPAHLSSCTPASMIRVSPSSYSRRPLVMAQCNAYFNRGWWTPGVSKILLECEIDRPVLNMPEMKLQVPLLPKLEPYYYIYRGESKKGAIHT